MSLASILFTVALAASPGPERRAALIIGANAAPPGRPTLRFAFRDAEHLRDALVRVGGVRPQDAVLLRDPTPDELLASLKLLSDTLSAQATETVLYFYYSGHADESALYPGGLPLSLEAVRRALIEAHVTVKVGIIDACSGGGWTRAKGLTPGPAVTLKPITLATEGSVLIASSSGLEEAHESEALAGSFFTHHLVAGLLGAADASGDGVVSATEAFTYAQSQTVRASARASVEPQHPSFEWNLRGRRDLALAQLTDNSTLTLNQSVGPLQVVELPSGLVLLELPEGERRARLAVPPGTYLIRRIDERQVSTAREVQVVAGQVTTVEERSLELVGKATVEAKSSEVVVRGTQASVLPAHTVEAKRDEVIVPRTQESILPAHTISFAVRGGVSSTVWSDTGLEGSLRAAWSPVDWLEVGFLAPSVTFMVGQRHRDEALLFVGLDSFGLRLLDPRPGRVLIDRLMFSARASGAWRHWFSSEVSLVTSLAALGVVEYGISAQAVGEAQVAVTCTARRWVSLNLAVTGSSTLAPYGALTIGSPRIGGRVMPLIDFHLSPIWSFGARPSADGPRERRLNPCLPFPRSNLVTHAPTRLAFPRVSDGLRPAARPAAVAHGHGLV